ncbi:MAG: pentapeptide repeat-containing protein [Desulfobacteraceae bacterium]|nr:pentapeptide repeat-containing protein [Desulfobacteraceae bacterium]
MSLKWQYGNVFKFVPLLVPKMGDINLIVSMKRDEFKKSVRIKGVIFMGLMEKITDVQIKKSEYIEDVAEKFVEAMCKINNFLLVRMFIILPYKLIPLRYQFIVNKIIQFHKAHDQLNKETPVLSLLATYGKNTVWNNRHNSQRHKAIPLIPGKIIDSFPMIPIMLDNVGYNIDNNNENDYLNETLDITIDRTIAKFYIKDARTEVDKKGKKIIYDQNFVKKYGVRTVFGFADGYIASTTSIVLVIFSQKILDKSFIREYSKYLLNFKMKTIRLESTGNFFSKDIEYIQKIIEKHKTWINSKNKGSQFRIRSANFRKLRLKELNLSNAFLPESDFWKSILIKPDFQYAIFSKANFQNTNIQKANFQGADFIKANFQEANLEKANLQRVKFREANLKNANLRESSLQHAVLYGANLQGANLQGANLQSADLGKADLKMANLMGADLRGADIQDAVFTGADLSEIIISENLTKHLSENKHRKSWVVSDVIIKSIEFPPEYHQAGISILNYFGTVLRKKYPDVKAKVKIEQDGLKVTMIVDTIGGDKEVIEKTLNEYGLVITGKMLPEEFTENNGLLKIELESKLTQARAEIETQKLLLQYQDEQLRKKEIRLDKFLDVIETAFKKPVNINTSIDVSQADTMAKNSSAITNGKVGDIEINE